ncbi:MAG: hypothetical protein ABIX01_22540 [Chitinophagaceae bacterium]
MLTTQYQVLFTITLQHDYYGGSAFSDLSIVPSAETEKLLRDYKILWDNTNNVLTALMKADNNEPTIAFNPNAIFRFYVINNNGAFVNFSALKMIDSKNAVYYFSNKAANKKNNRLYISAPVATYDENNTYELGSVVKKGGRVFECISASSKTNKHDAVEGDFWRDIVVHQSRFLLPYSDIKTYQPGDQVNAATQLFECLKPNSAIDKHGTATDFWAEIKELAYITQSDLSSMETIATMDIGAYNNTVTYPEGAWVTEAGKFFESLRLSSNSDKHGTAETAFWKEVNAADIIRKRQLAFPLQTLAVVDIVSNGTTADYALLAGKKIQGRSYLLRFKNRSTTWKYISQKSGVISITDTGNVYAFANPAGTNQFVSQKPIPLSQAPLSTLKLNATINARPVELNGLQNPGVAGIKLSDNTANYQLFSEIFLNY